MKKLLFLLLSLIPFISTPAYASQTVQIPVEANTEISLIHEGEVKEKKNIIGKDVFNIDVDGIGKYEYALTDGKTTINVDIYITNDGETSVIYTGEVKLNKAVFDDGSNTEENEETNTETTKEIEKNTGESETTINLTSNNPNNTVITNTGDSNLTPVWIIVVVGAGAGVGVTTYFLKKKYKGR